MIPGSIPPNVRNSIKTTSGFSIGSCQQKQEQNNFKIQKGTKGKSKEKISAKGFVEKLGWLEEHLKELAKLKAPTEIINNVSKQIERLEDLVGNLERRKK